MNLLLLYICVKLNEIKHNPLKISIFYSIVSFLIGLMFDGFSMPLVINGIFAFIFCFIFLHLLVRYEDDFSMWLVILIVGMLLFAGAGKLILGKFF